MVRNFKRGLPTQILQIGFHCFYIFRFSNLNSHLVFRRSILNDSRFLTLHVRFSTIGSQLLVCNARLWNVSFVTCLFSVLYFAFWVWNCPCSNFDFRPVDFFVSVFIFRMSDVRLSISTTQFLLNVFKNMLKLRGNKFEGNLRRVMDCVGTVCGGIPWKNPTVLRTTCWNNSDFFHRWWRWILLLTVYLELVLNHARPLPLSLSHVFPLQNNSELAAMCSKAGSKT